LALADRNLFISRDQYLQITSHLKVNNPIVVLSSLAKNSSFSKELIAKERKDRRQNDEQDRAAFFFTVAWHTQEQYRRKGIFETLGALALLKERTDFQFRWLIAGGEGDGLSVLRTRIVELGLEDNVEVRVDISQGEKRELFLCSDLYIQPSWCEGFGNAVLEATSHGLPALVSRYTAQPEVVGDSGYIAMEMSAEGICRELQAFLALDCHGREQLEKEVLEHVERHFTFEKRLKALENVSREMGLDPRTSRNPTLDIGS
jgi:glycosyltransferase involved in cell wall biosynthesis